MSGVYLNVLGYQLAVPPLAAVGGGERGEGSPLIYRENNILPLEFFILL